MIEKQKAQREKILRDKEMRRRKAAEDLKKDEVKFIFLSLFNKTKIEKWLINEQFKLMNNYFFSSESGEKDER